MAELTFRSGEFRTVNHTPSSAVAAGEVVVIGDVPFVAHHDIAANAPGALAARGGVYRGSVAAAVAGEGVSLYWDDTNNEYTATASGNTHFGHSAGASIEGDTLVDAVHAPLIDTPV